MDGVTAEMIDWVEPSDAVCVHTEWTVATLQLLVFDYISVITDYNFA